MYYQSLKDIEICLSNSNRTEDKMIAKYVCELDEWLISRPTRYKNRLNPLQFSFDNNISIEIVEYLFELGVEKNLFEVYYEAETDFKEPLGLITQDNFDELIEKGNIKIEHPFKDEICLININNVEILFSLKERPTKILDFKNFPSKKAIAPAYTGDKAGESLREALLNRGTRK
ncbi:hypothetical protein [Enterococcus faecalis]|uniref:hypothetical protein n=1 Tax=Enterococcus faecalis TaxID=1351 RepID=UPI001780999E|nr:hypothetical protein [Enterococcus faecalis]MBD9882921.1 hypothetical protein [Enterococcus faecalis]